MTSIPVARALHDVGLAAWFGGSLMGVVAINGAAAKVSDPGERALVLRQGWSQWAPVNAAAIGAHLLGGALILKANRGRLIGQHGVAGWTTAKTVATAAALGSTALSSYYGAQLTVHPDRAAEAQRRLTLLQWATPALGGAMIYITAVMSEQQRPGQVFRGTALRLAKTTRAVAKHPHAARAVATHLASRAMS